MKRTAIAVALIVSLGWLGCGCPSGDSGCKNDSDCKGSRVCQAGECVEPTPTTPVTAATVQPATTGCSTDRDCKGNRVCKGGSCVEPTAPPPAPPPVGQPPMLGTEPVWVLSAGAYGSKPEAEKDLAQYNSLGFRTGVLWIPDYSSLSGAKMWLGYVGPYSLSDKAAAQAELARFKAYRKDSYGIKVDQSGKRETFN